MSNADAIERLRQHCIELVRDMLVMLDQEHPGLSEAELLVLCNQEMADNGIPGSLELVEGGFILHIQEKGE